MIAEVSVKFRCLLFDSGKIKIYDGKKYFEMNYRYFIYDGKLFEETVITTKISEFDDIMKIILLNIYFLEYYVEK
jgi:hypothetical protein